MEYFEEQIANSLVFKNAVNSRATLSGTQTQVGTAAARKQLFLYHETPVSSGPVYVGLTGVTTATGFRVPPNLIVKLPFSGDVVVFGIAVTSTDLSVFEGW